MTTSPSWFDQDKFSRLIKKVGPKAPSGKTANGSPGGSGAPIQMRKVVPVAPAAVSLVSPDSALKSGTSVSPAPTKLPAPMVKPLFSYDEKATSTSTISQSSASPTASDARAASVKETPAPTARPATGQVASTPAPQESGQGTAAVNEELARLREEREQALTEAKLLREQLRQAEQVEDDRAVLFAQIAELSEAAEERDQALTAYADLREINDALKREMARPREETGPDRAELQQEIETLRQQLAEQVEINVQANNAGLEDIIETLKRELSALRDQVSLLQQQIGAAQQQTEAAQEQVNILQQQADNAQLQLIEAKEEASVAQRALALSQKTLQETRDALREATEGSSVNKDDLENLKKERSTLVQQNMLLQAQFDQVSRELSAAKSKMAARA